MGLFVKKMANLRYVSLLSPKGRAGDRAGGGFAYTQVLLAMLICMGMEKRLWFKAKTYGWGWTPATWEGWAVIGVYALLLIAILKRADLVVRTARETLLEVTLPILVMTAVLIGISYWKGEPPRWRWGQE